MAMHWYVLRSVSGKEKKAVEYLRSRIEQNSLDNYFDEILIPTENVVEMRSGKKRSSERMFFPGYILVKMELNDQTWHLVKEVPNVLGFIGGSADKPAPISQAEVDKIMQRVEEGVEKPKPKVLFEVGEVVLITDGPFADYNGVIEKVQYDKDLLSVAVLIFGRSMAVDLKFNQVEKS